MSLKKLVIVTIGILLLNTTVRAATMTGDCLAHYANDTGELRIPCLVYREVEAGVPHDKFLYVYLKKVTSSTPGVLLLEVSGFEDSHIQEEHIIHNDDSVSSPSKN